jgi:V/A-type H+/Na+-transporting ATPase subunit K
VKLRVWLLLGTTLVLTLFSTLLFWTGTASAAPAEVAALSADPALARWAFVAAAVATAVSSVAAAYAVARVGSAAVGALTEKPELFGRMVVLVGLAEGIAIYGLIISILILNRLE